MGQDNATDIAALCLGAGKELAAVGECVRPSVHPSVRARAITTMHAWLAVQRPCAGCCD
jgi:hypothetical protein